MVDLLLNIINKIRIQNLPESRCKLTRGIGDCLQGHISYSIKFIAAIHSKLGWVYCLQIYLLCCFNIVL